MRRPAMMLHARCLRISRWHLATSAHLPWPGELAIDEPDDPPDDGAVGAWEGGFAPRASARIGQDCSGAVPAHAITQSRTEVAACNRS